MLNNITGSFDGIFNNAFSSDDMGKFLMCIIVSLVIGFALASVHALRDKPSQNFLVTLALIPAIVCVIIMMVNGNVGAGVAVAGAFSLIRFRSIPGTSREIGAIFMAMGAGIMTGMGYLGYAFVFTVIISVFMLIFYHIGAWKPKLSDNKRTLHITIPENLDYTDVFEDLMEEYTACHRLVNVRTTNMGSLFKLTYELELKASQEEKEFMDKLRCRNGNLEITMTIQGFEQPISL